MPVYKTAFSGPVACKVVSVQDTRDITPIHGNPIPFFLCSVLVEIEVTARKNTHYKRGEILTVFAMDIFDTVKFNRTKCHYCGKEWASYV